MADPKSSEAPPLALPTRLGEVDADFVARFRGEVHGLGGFWLLQAAAATALLVLQSAPGPDSPFAWIREPWAPAFVAGCAVSYVTLGVLTFLKKPWALMAGLGVGYISLIVSVLSWLGQASTPGNLRGSFPYHAMISVAVLLQCQRVLGWAKQMLAEGIPLTARPADLLPRIDRHDPAERPDTP